MEEINLTNLLPNSLIIVNQFPCKVIEVSPPKKAGKHGSAKIFYTYISLKDKKKTETVGSSRDKILLFKPSFSKGLFLEKDSEEVSLLIDQEIKVVPSCFLIYIGSAKKLDEEQFLFFKIGDFFYYHYGK